VVEVPFAFVPCQYHVVPVGGVPERVIVTVLHCGELLVGFEGAEIEFTDTFTAILLLTQISV
jgi:hypothetical protein